MMSKEEIDETVRGTIIDVLDLDDDAVIEASMTAQDVPGWDSLNHVRIILSLERKLKFRLTEAEIASLKKVGDMFDIVSQKVSANA